ncbi:pathogenesis-related protein PR-1 type-like [Phoenix dactylifera]|uniref:Pathogenesis-related protein PR-1 type-like n=1 Tax=Phoenix dactylifera TaxID=42345 RepID=A0A8B7CGQ6_PHODC|nr:pathogenesis-related protein PR-1 type-like [Phoenix dactylifera]
MGSSSLISFFCATVLVMAHATLAQNSPDDFVNAHNAAREAVGVGPVSWNTTVASYAEDYANQRKGDCQLIHSDSISYGYGENLFIGGGPDFTAKNAVDLWVGEKQYYDYDSNSCSAPPGQSCGHYTQVVWRDSTGIGCARIQCDSSGTFITCNYSPPGNVERKRPY